MQPNSRQTQCSFVVETNTMPLPPLALAQLSLCSTRPIVDHMQLTARSKPRRAPTERDG